MTRLLGSETVLKIRDIVKDNVARFSFYRAGHAFYEVEVDGTKYKFPVSLEDLGTATLLAEHKAITLMRYIARRLRIKRSSRRTVLVISDQGLRRLSCPVSGVAEIKTKAH